MDVALENLCTIICEAVNSLKPSNRPIPKRPKPKWYDKELKKLKIKQEQSYHRYIENKTIANKVLSNQAKNIFFFTLKKKRNNFFEKKFQINKKNSKAIWKMINKLLGRKKKTTSSISLQVGSTLVEEPTEVANIFNSYFSNVAKDIRSKLPNTIKKFTEYLPSRSHRTAYLFVTTESEITIIIKKLKRKFSLGLDGISTDILKALPYNIIAAITQIFNQCLTDGYFPTKFKTAKIVPVYKKKGSRSKKENYRPVSLLSCLSKILEKLVSKRIVSFLHKQNFFSKFQFGFRKGLSTEHAISLLVNKITRSMNQKKKTLGIFLDLSKAFDLIDHNILLQKLDRYGIRGVANKWFKSYLSNRKQLVCVAGHLSSTILDVEYGAPQGSILGPLLFLIYINDLPSCLEHSTPVFYADDSNLLISDSNCQTLIRKGNEDLANVQNWILSNKLALNIGKTQAIIFRTPNTRIPSNLSKLKIGENEIKLAEKTEFLGVIITKSLSWKLNMKAKQIPWQEPVLC